MSLGGPVATNRTFFFGNYEGSKLKSLGGGSQAIVPTAAMRNGDFSANAFVVRDPVTGVQFPGNRIPADRIDPSARRILDFFYPLPNQANLAAGGYGAYRQILPQNRERDRADVRVDHELSGRDSLFARVSWQRRDPDAFTFESTGGNGGAGLTNLGLLDRQSKATTLAAGWTRIWSGTLVNEFRGGYSTDTRNRKSHFVAGDAGASSGSSRRRWRPRSPGFPSFLFSGANRPSDIRDQRQNAFRDLDQSSFSLSSSTTWLKGRHSIKFGGIYTRNFAKDGYSTGRERVERRLRLLGICDGQCVRGPPARAAEPDARAAQYPRRPADGHVLERLGGVRAGRRQAESPAHAVPRAAVRGHRRLRGQERHLRELRPDRRRASRRAEHRDRRAAASGRRSDWAARSRRTSSTSAAG